MYDDTKNKGTAVRKTDTWTTYEIRPQLIPKERKPYFCFCVDEIRLHKIIIVGRNSFSVFVRPKNGHAKYFRATKFVELNSVRKTDAPPKISFTEYFMLVWVARCQSNSDFGLMGYRGDICPQHSYKCPTNVFYRIQIKLHLKNKKPLQRLTSENERLSDFLDNLFFLRLCVKLCRSGCTSVSSDIIGRLIEQSSQSSCTSINQNFRCPCQSFLLLPGW